MLFDKHVVWYVKASLDICFRWGIDIFIEVILSHLSGVLLLIDRPYAALLKLLATDSIIPFCDEFISRSFHLSSDDLGVLNVRTNLSVKIKVVIPFSIS